jgi:hypothetical protein
MKIPRKPPTLEARTEREGLLERCAPWTVLPTTPKFSAFTTKDSINLFRVYDALAAHADRNGLVQVGRQRIATLLSIHKDTVGKAIKRLIERRLIELAWKKPIAHNRFICVYRINFLRPRKDTISTGMTYMHAHPLNRARRTPTALAA